MFVISKPQTKNTLVKSSYVHCARNITSANLHANIGHLCIKNVQAAAVVDEAIVADSKIASTKSYESELDYGEVIAVSGGASDSRKVTVVGEDYLGNAMVEEITLNNANAVSGKKAFKRIFDVFVASAGAAVKLSTTAKIGLPFQTVGLLKAIKNGTNDTTATVTAFSHEQTATSADPRGTVSLAHCVNGDEVELLYIVTEFCTKVNGKDSKGGLFGVKPFAG